MKTLICLPFAVQSPSLTMSPTTSNSASPDHHRSNLGQVFFADDDFKERLLENQVKKSTHKMAIQRENELRKSSSAGSGSANKKLFDTKAPIKQKLSIHPSSIMPPNSTPPRIKSSSDNKSTAISNIGGDLLRSKTADFERFLIGQNNNTEPRTYKRKELISSAHNSTK